MYFLQNPQLTVELLDPMSATDVRLLGTRFAWGGFLWQVRNSNGSPLLAGPQWPAPSPDPYHGQGMPESFALEIDLDHAPSLRGEAPRIIGVGVAEIGADGKAGLAEPCIWSVEANQDSITFHTHQTTEPLSLCLVRSIELRGNTVSSRSRVLNLGSIPFSTIWFAHPNFPLANGCISCLLPTEYRMKENPDFWMNRFGHLALRRPFLLETDNHLEWLSGVPHDRFLAAVDHPTVKRVQIRTDFPPDRLGVWANRHTFSIEPYAIRRVPPRGCAEWSISYTFSS